LLYNLVGSTISYSSSAAWNTERRSKLLLPLIFGILLIVPIQAYLAGLFFNGSANYLNYFTRITDLSGYDGAFTPGQLWFLLFLFVISLICLPLMVWYKKKGKGTLGSNVPLILVVLMGLLPCIGSLLKIGGKSPTEDMAYFLLGFFFLTSDKLLSKLEKYRFILLGLSVAYAIFTTFVLQRLLFEVASWLAILTLLGLGKRYLNFRRTITGYISKSSFGIYIFHQSWIVIAAFFIFKITDSPYLQIPLIFLSVIILTYVTYEACRRTPVTRWMFGLKKMIQPIV